MGCKRHEEHLSWRMLKTIKLGYRKKEKTDQMTELTWPDLTLYLVGLLALFFYSWNIYNNTNYADLQNGRKRCWLFRLSAERWTSSCHSRHIHTETSGQHCSPWTRSVPSSRGRWTALRRCRWWQTTPAGPYCPLSVYSAVRQGAAVHEQPSCNHGLLLATRPHCPSPAVSRDNIYKNTETN